MPTIVDFFIAKSKNFSSNSLDDLRWDHFFNWFGYSWSLENIISMGRFDSKAVIKEAGDEFINDTFKISSNRQVLHPPLEDDCLNSLKTMQITRVFF